MYHVILTPLSFCKSAIFTKAQVQVYEPWAAGCCQLLEHPRQQGEAFNFMGRSRVLIKVVTICTRKPES